jgi:hypothetical protein
MKRVWNFSANVLHTLLRFFNLLEPDVPYMVLSLSKLAVWMTLGLTMYVVMTGSGLHEIGAALIANLGALGNYVYRRGKQVETRTGGYGLAPAPMMQDNFATPGLPDADPFETQSLDTFEGEP